MQQQWVGSQGLVVPFGYVTAQAPNGGKRTYQQGEFIPPSYLIVEAAGSNENDPARSTKSLLRLLGAKSTETEPETDDEP